MSNETILVARNHHIPGEPPPALDNEGPRTVSYFEGSCGDEWVFWYDPESRQAFISGGDIGWERRRCDEARHGLVLGQAELLWLAGCLLSAGETHDNPGLEESAGKVLDVFLTYVKRGGLEAMRRQQAWDEGRDPTEQPRRRRASKRAT